MGRVISLGRTLAVVFGALALLCSNAGARGNCPGRDFDTTTAVGVQAVIGHVPISLLPEGTGANTTKNKAENAFSCKLDLKDEWYDDPISRDASSLNSQSGLTFILLVPSRAMVKKKDSVLKAKAMFFYKCGSRDGRTPDVIVPGDNDRTCGVVGGASIVVQDEVKGVLEINVPRKGTCNLSVSALGWTYVVVLSLSDSIFYYSNGYLRRM
jgi:hypothetical protein